MALLRGLVLLTVAFRFLSHSASAQVLRPAEIRGCYDLQFGSWSPPPHQPLDTLRYLPPPRVEFDTVPWNQWSEDTEAFLVKPAPDSRSSRHRFTMWEVQEDSVLAVWSTGYVGVRVYLGKEGDHLSGRAETFSDSYGPGDRDYLSDVNAIRVPCSKAPDYPTATSQFVLRSIGLASGQTIELGNPLPDRGLIESRRNTRTFVVRGQTVGAFSEASEIRVEEARSGVVQEIHLLFPQDTDVEGLRTRLEEMMGRRGDPSSSRSTFSVGWQDVATSLSLVAADGRVEVFIFDPRLF